MPYQPLTREEYQKALDSGFSENDIIGFEQRRKSEMSIPTNTVSEADKLAFREHPFRETGKIALENLKTAGRDLIQPAASFANQFLFNLPRTAVETYGGKYPTEEGVSDPTIKAASYAAGVVGGFKNPLAKAVMGGSQKLIPTMARSAGAATLYGTKDMFDPEAIKENAQFGALVSGGAKLGGESAKFATQLGGKALRFAGDVSSQSVKWLKERGANKIFDPLKEKVDYIKTTLVPQIYPLYEKNTQGLLDKAGNAMSKSMSNIKSDYMDYTKTLSSLRNILDDNGLLNAKGKVIFDIKDREIPQAVKLMGEMYSNATERGKTTPILNKKYFDYYRKALRSVQKNAGAFKIDVQNVINNLYDDAEMNGAKGIKAAKEAYHNAMDILDEFEMSKNSFATKIQQATNPKEWNYIKESLRPVFGKNTDEIFNNIKDHVVALEFSPAKRGGFGMVAGARKGIRMGLREYYEKGYTPIEAAKRNIKSLIKP